MSYDSLMLYTEDTFELPGYPYFGHMRGRFSKEELKEIDDYAYISIMKWHNYVTGCVL